MYNDKDILIWLYMEFGKQLLRIFFIKRDNFHLIKAKNAAWDPQFESFEPRMCNLLPFHNKLLSQWLIFTGGTCISSRTHSLCPPNILLEINSNTFNN